MMDGEIDLESEVGEGSKFEVEFLTDYAGQLQDQIAGFEVVKIKDTLEECEDLLAKLKTANK